MAIPENNNTSWFAWKNSLDTSPGALPLSMPTMNLNGIGPIGGNIRGNYFGVSLNNSMPSLQAPSVGKLSGVTPIQSATQKGPNFFKRLQNLMGQSWFGPALAASDLLGSVIGGGKSSKVGDFLNQVPGGKLLGGITNALFGTKFNEENLNRWKDNIAEMGNFTSNEGTYDGLQGKMATAPQALSFDRDDIYSDGLLTDRGENVYNELDNQADINKNLVADSLIRNREGIRTSTYQNQLADYFDNGGILNIRSGGVLSPFGNRFSKGGTIDALLLSNGSKWDDGLRHINVGGSHEQNPNGGVLQGVDSQGVPNFVQEGEVIWDDNKDAPYVFSNELKTPRGLREKYKLRGEKGTSFANDVMDIEKRYAEFKNDPISKRAMDNILSEFRDTQENVRIKKEQRKQAREAQRLLEQQYAQSMQPYLNPSLLNNEMVGAKEMPAEIFKEGGNMGLKKAKRTYRRELRKRDIGRSTSPSMTNEEFNEYLMRPNVKTVRIGDISVDIPKGGGDPRYTGRLTGKDWFIANGEWIKNNVMPLVPYTAPGLHSTVEAARRIVEQPGNHQYTGDYEFGGGNFGGGGASNGYSLDRIIPPDIDWDLLPIGYKRTFNDAYREARERGDKTFEFNGGVYTTDYNPNVPNWKELGNNRVESGWGIVPFPHHDDGGYINKYDDGSFLDVNPYYDAVTNTYDTDYYKALPDIINSIATNNTKSNWLKTFNRTIPEVSIDLGKDKDNNPYTWQDMSKLKAGDEAYDRQYKYITSSDFAKSPLGLTAANIYAQNQLAQYGLQPTGANLKYFQELTPEDKESIKKQMGTDAAVTNLAQWIAERKPNGEATGENLDEYQQYVNDKVPISKLSGLRYIPALGAGLSVFSDLMGWTNKADLSGPNFLRDAATRVPDVRFNPISGYMPNNYLDTQYYLNQLYANSAQGRRYLANLSGGNAAALRAGLVGNDYNYNNKIGDALVQALNYNNARRDAKAQNDLKVNMFNAEQQAKASQLNSANAATRAQLVKDYIAARDAVQGRSDANISLNLSNLFNSLGDIGREEFQKNMINTNNAMYYTIGSNGQITYKPSFFNLPPEYRWMMQERAYQDAQSKQGKSKSKSK